MGADRRVAAGPESDEGRGILQVQVQAALQVGRQQVFFSYKLTIDTIDSLKRWESFKRKSKLRFKLAGNR